MDDADEIRRDAEIDKLLSRAHVFRMRQQYIEAEDTLREALSLNPVRWDIVEDIADVLTARGKIDEAAEEYKRIFQSDSERSESAELKYARLALQMGESKREKELAQQMIDNPAEFRTPRGHPLPAFFLSAVVPGLGQIFNRQLTKGLILISVFLLSLLALAALPQDTKNLIKYVSMALNPGAIEGHSPPVGTMVIFFVCALVTIYFYAIVDAAVTAAAMKETKNKTEQPTETPS